jgi:predicted TIM-barrel fold metal-dependent hydrolase
VSTRPPIVSLDDHVIEPPDLWQRWLPAKWRDAGPRVERDNTSVVWIDGNQVFRRGGDGPATDWWVYDDLTWAHQMLNACAGYTPDEWWMGPIGFDQMRPGCFDPKARLADMDRNNMRASLCFPTFPRFAGQLFAERRDKDLALACVRAYNDWMVDEWCGDSGGRLLPLGIVPLWDPQLAVDELRRNAARGVRGVAFSELPGKVGLPTIHDRSRHWDPFFAAAADTDTTVFMHIGSGSTWITSSPDAPPPVTATLVFMTTAMALTDWLFSGVLARHPSLRVCFAEGQVGWMPYVVERADKIWAKGDVWAGPDGRLPQPPSSYLRQVYGCIYDDDHGLESRHVVGVDRITFETDYPHQDSTWPDSSLLVERIAAKVSPEELTMILHDNAADLMGLSRWDGVTTYG